MIEVKIINRRITVPDAPMIVCGNSDYILNVDFDSEWDGVENISAQFRYLRDGLPVTEYVPLTNGACSIPAIRGACAVEIGISGGNIRTAAPAVVACMPCCTDLRGTEKTPVLDVYNEIMEIINRANYSLSRMTHSAMEALTHESLSAYTHG